MARILVVDDEPRIREVVSAYLARDGHEVSVAADGDGALELARLELPDLVVLDVMLPGRSGFDVLRALRSEGISVPVILLTARDDVVDRVAGLEIGADDYVTKPFEPRELVARVGAVLRRTARSDAVGWAGSGSVPAAQPPVRQAGSPFFDLAIDVEAREVQRSGTAIALTRTEFDLVAALCDQPGRVWTREQIGARLFGESFDAYDRTIDSHVKNVRHKLGSRPDGGPYIETVRGVGYRAARS
jgi:DNA-binding response OmpR family regulator